MFVSSGPPDHQAVEAPQDCVSWGSSDKPVKVSAGRITWGNSLPRLERDPQDLRPGLAPHDGPHGMRSIVSDRTKFFVFGPHAGGHDLKALAAEPTSRRLVFRKPVATSRRLVCEIANRKPVAELSQPVGDCLRNRKSATGLRNRKPVAEPVAVAEKDLYPNRRRTSSLLRRIWRRTRRLRLLIWVVEAGKMNIEDDGGGRWFGG
nr:hypothetical protein Iba_chr11fCG9570 [Ipomoea batatas]